MKKSKVLIFLNAARRILNPNQQPRRDVDSIDYEVFIPRTPQDTGSRKKAEENYRDWGIGNQADPSVGPTEQEMIEKIERGQY